MAHRDAYFDNLKFLLIALVVVGHAIEPLSSDPALRPLYLTIYAFHIPLFVLISGYFCKNITSTDYRIKVVGSLVVPYLIFETLYSLYDYAFSGGQRLTFSYFTPYWLMWFIFSSIIWKAVLPYAVKIRGALPISIVVAVLAGYATDAEYYASISRTIVFFPFFLAGYYLDKKTIIRLRTPLLKGLSIFVLAAAGVIMVKYGSFIRAEWFYGSLPYRALGHPEWTAGLYRIAAYAASVLIGGAVMILMTGRTVPHVSKLGRNTLYAYLLHGFVVRSLPTSWLYDHYGAGWWMAALIPLGLLLTAFLSSEPVMSRFRWLLEPNLDRWFKKADPAEQGSGGRRERRPQPRND
ncbi:acyltransferase family protein [Saccharibacillus sp. CPCC 101409]|uniref:acyltransferase family protein n=1 Tax=Saccharibacillus sp. CPCC 101409 TaxID=3058041 RepID=UPI002672ED39|nr:acyltransferase family protein [Saccharibacillus sp. CPCC 101409]MDO3411817.1 acyltransferase family protein [Saccharibacillus sp. CPCC 101409]